ncbi:MAG TPA: glutamate--tRNA ligase, partial [Hyphomicrobiaceae bacterium]|nr:glutamate--tRNA ligase [Hyphomicrobiaceae bacterium]
LNAKLLHQTPHEKVADRLAALGCSGGAPFWAAVRGNVTRLSDARQWHDVVSGAITPVIEDAAFTAEAAKLLPAGVLDETSWGTWTSAVKEATGRKGRALFHPLRLALTGVENGPELKALLPLIGRERALARLQGHRA